MAVSNGLQRQVFASAPQIYHVPCSIFSNSSFCARSSRPRNYTIVRSTSFSFDNHVISSDNWSKLCLLTSLMVPFQCLGCVPFRLLADRPSKYLARAPG